MDDLTKIKGVGAATARKLVAAGIDSFRALAFASHTDEPLVSIAKSDIEAVAWITAAAKLANVPPSQGATVSQEKPSGSDAKPEAHVDDRAGLPADSGAGDPHVTAPAIPPESDRREGAGNPAGPAKGEPKGKAAEQVPDFAPSAVIVKAKRDGYRRGGIAHTREEVSHDIGLFTPEQLEQLVADPALTVRLA